MSTIKISQLTQLTTLNSNTANTLFVGVDVPTGVTAKFTATSLANQLYANNVLNVGNNPLVLPNTVAQFAGNASNYLQLNLQNNNANGSADYIVTADVGTDTTDYIDMGFTNRNYSNVSPFNSLGTSIEPMDGYLYVQGNTGVGPGGNLIIGTV